MPQFSLKFPLRDVCDWSARYRYETDPSEVQAAQPIVRQAGYLTKDQFLAVVRWKAPRAIRKAQRNPEDLIVEATRTAFGSTHEPLRIGILTLIHGVGFPMASAILHWLHTDRYPILDYRALWSLGISEPPQYSLQFWWSYTQHCRALADQAGVDMRTLDRALWQYSKEHQPPKSRRKPVVTIA
jgi:hypothetical protein